MLEGANNLDKRKIICNFVRSQRVDLICVRETRIQELSNACACSLGVSRFHDWKALEAEGAAGGILLFWDKRKMDLVQAEIGSLSITGLFKNMEDGLRGRSQEFMARLKGEIKRSSGKSWGL